MPTLRMFAQAREAAGIGHDDIAGGTVGEMLEAAVERYGDDFASVLTICAIWVNGEPADRMTNVVATDEVAVLPPVSGGSE